MVKSIVSKKAIPSLLIILFIVQGIIFSGMFPIWEPFDEPAHFSYIQHIVERKTLPTFEDYLSNEIVSTFYTTPMVVQWLESKDCCNITENSNFHTSATFWDNFDLEEIQKNREAISSQTLESRITSEPFIANYEVGQPPLGYLAQAPVYLLFYDQDLLTRVFALRIFSILITAVAAIVAYKTISLLFDDRLMRIGSLMFIVFNPMFLQTSSRVSNETFTILLFSIFLYLMVLYLKGKTNTLHVILIGVVLGLGLLTKATFMPAVMLVSVFIFLKYFQNNPHKPRISILQSLKNLGLILGITISMGSWWYYERFAAGNPTGWANLPRITFDQFIQAIFQVPWMEFFFYFYWTFWGIYGMNFFDPPSIVKSILIPIFLGISITCLGFGITLKVKQKGRKIVRDWRYQSIFALALSTLFIILAQALFNIQIFVVMDGSMFPNGWFILISFTAIAMILLLGYRTLIINTKLKRFKEESLLTAFIILIVFNVTTFYWLVPNYYNGA